MTEVINKLVIMGVFLGMVAGYSVRAASPSDHGVSDHGLLNRLVEVEEANKARRHAFAFPSSRSDFQDTLGVTRKDGDVFIVSRVRRLDLRQAIEDFLEGGRNGNEARRAPIVSQRQKEKKSERSDTEPLILNVDMEIGELFLPGDVMVEGVRANFIYRGNHQQDRDADILAFIQNLSDILGRELLRGLERLTLSGKIRNGKDASDLTITISMEEPARKKIIIRSDDAGAMLRMKGRDYFKGGRYKLHAIWEEDEQVGEKIIGTIQIRDFYMTDPSVWIRLMSGIFSLKGFFGVINDQDAFFEKIEFPFRITARKRDIRCRIFFSPELYVPCGTF